MKKTIFCILCGITGIIQCLSCAAQQTTVTRPKLDVSTVISTQTVNEDSASISLVGYNAGIEWVKAEDTLKTEWYNTINNDTSGSIYKGKQDKYYQTGVKYAAYTRNQDFEFTHEPGSIAQDLDYDASQDVEYSQNDNYISNNSPLQIDVDMAGDAKTGFDEGSDWVTITDKQKQDLRAEMIRSWVKEQTRDMKYFKTGIDYAAYQNKIEFHWEKPLYQK